MSRKVCIADFGSGNLLSVCRAFSHCGAEVVLAATAAEIAAADRLVVPGVGAFAKSMQGLAERGLTEPVRRFAETGRPMMGICVGMQMLFDRSEEFGEHHGLGLVPGDVRRIPATGADGRPHKVPHVGWNRLNPGAAPWGEGILAGIPDGSYVYFVHSYAGYPRVEAHRLADADYDGCRISAAVQNGMVSGCQFHPEKSGRIGLRILENFLAL